MPMAISTQQSMASTRAVRLTGWVWFAGSHVVYGLTAGAVDEWAN
jgi:hypothetical protein